MEEQKINFTSELLFWHKSNTRELPWKLNKDPYSIWLSEIILQQTRVEQGTPYYLKFIKAFPKVEDLANADIDTIMSLWEGLGYYSRARNLHHTAQYISDELAGVFPRLYEDIIKLKGIGPYTAAAISSFAYDEVYAVVDGNVIRLISRYFGITDFVDDTIIKKQINGLAQQCISKQYPAEYNQAIMDYGSTVCKPKSPNCIDCVLQEQCIAYQFGNITSIPAKAKKIKKRNRFFHFFIISNNNSILLEKRINKDIWQELYQFPMIENENDVELSPEIINNFLKILSIPKFIISFKDDIWYKQTLTHQNIRAKFYHIHLNEAVIEKSHPYYLVDTKNLENFAFPKIINAYPNKLM